MNLNLRQVLPKRDETFELAPGIPPLHTSQLPWINVGAAQPSIFELFSCIDRLTALTDIVVCYSFCEVEAGAFKLLPNVLPIGPLISDDGELWKPIWQFLP